MKRAMAVMLAVLAMPCAARAEEGARMLREPTVPLAVRKEAQAEAPRVPSQGGELRAQAEAKLRAPFDAAARDGWLTRDAAHASSLGFIDRHFDEIDVGRRGALRFEDYKRFLKSRGAALD